MSSQIDMPDMYYGQQLKLLSVFLYDTETINGDMKLSDLVNILQKRSNGESEPFFSLGGW